MGFYVRRADYVKPNPDNSQVRNFLVKAVEAATPALLQTEINALLLTGPNNIPNNVGIDVIDIQYLVTGTGGNTKYIAFLTIYFSGLQKVTTFEP
jgi:hypothetical protein